MNLVSISNIIPSMINPLQVTYIYATPDGRVCVNLSDGSSLIGDKDVTSVVNAINSAMEAKDE